MMPTKMTNEFDEKVHVVRMLELEVREIELNDRLAQLKGGPLANEIDELRDRVALEAELSARKGDSEVLMEVVEVVRSLLNDTRSWGSGLNQIEHILKDYLAALTPPVEEEHRVIVKVGFLELP